MVSRAIGCLSDTLVLMLETAKRLKAESLSSGSDQLGQSFAAGMAESSIESLHTLKNQVETFGLAAEMGPVWAELREFLNGEGLP